MGVAWDENERGAPRSIQLPRHQERALCLLGRENSDFMSLAHTPQRFALRDIGAHTHIPGLLLTRQDVASAGVSGAIMGGVVAASAALEGDALEDLATG